MSSILYYTLVDINKFISNNDYLNWDKALNIINCDINNIGYCVEYGFYTGDIDKTITVLTKKQNNVELIYIEFPKNTNKNTKQNTKQNKGYFFKLNELK